LLFFFQEQLKREKIELENTLEKEQESLVNRLWKRMEKLETDKKLLQLKVQPTPHSYNTVRIHLLIPSRERENLVTQRMR
jgi:hypothetical protein